jgi:hypothetical protein
VEEKTTAQITESKAFGTNRFILVIIPPFEQKCVLALLHDRAAVGSAGPQPLYLLTHKSGFFETSLLPELLFCHCILTG